MTPPARISAAIEILDKLIDGAPSGKTLTNWARNNRYAGSKDRAAVRDIVFDCLRHRRSYGVLGGADTARGLSIGYLRAQGAELNGIFTGQKYAPPALTDNEQVNSGDLSKQSDAVRLDCPDWLWPGMEKDYGDNLKGILTLVQTRAPVFLRVNMRKASGEQAQSSLMKDGIETRPHPLCARALEVTSNERRINGSQPYLQGIVEIQDLASQAVVEALPLQNDQKILDYCAGGGGKSLAMADRISGKFYAYDANARRMDDLMVRASRAGVKIDILSEEKVKTAGPYDLVLCDVPCSGSGAWRRNPGDKWLLDQQSLDATLNTQSEILDKAAVLVSPKGTLAYATCSLFSEENRQQVDGFLARYSGWKLDTEKQFTPLDGGDGLYVATLKRI